MQLTHVNLYISVLLVLILLKWCSYEESLLSYSSRLFVGLFVAQLSASQSLDLNQGAVGITSVAQGFM